MDNSLLKELKQAGFNLYSCSAHKFETTEQHDKGQFIGDLYTCKLCDFQHLCSQRKTTGPCCSHLSAFHEGCLKAEEKYSTPTLSELIEACGDRFGSLIRTKLPFQEVEPKYLVQWLAKESRPHTIPVISYASTPEEAVARLRLSLNQKSPNMTTTV